MPLPADVEAKFPGLVDGYEQTSPEDPAYNCIAHAAGDHEAWWDPARQPNVYWPLRAPRNYSLAALEAAFGTLGYTRCATEELEDGLEKIAIFVNEVQEFAHAARQLEDGSWTSKIGRNEDIRHRLRQLEGAEYGTAAAFLARPRR